MGDQDNGADENDNDEDDDRAYLFSSYFFDFCSGDMCVYYFYCCATKVGLLKSTVVIMPDPAWHDDGTMPRLSIPISRSSKRDAGLMMIGEALSSPMQVRQRKEQEQLARVKRQICESKTYKILHDEYMELHTRTNSGNLPSFLLQTNKQRMKRIDMQLQSLAKQSQNVTSQIEQGIADDDENQNFILNVICADTAVLNPYP